MAIKFSDFVCLLEGERQLSTLGKHLVKLGSSPSDFPKAKKGRADYNEHHGFIDKHGKYYSVNHIEDTHRGATEHLIKTVPKSYANSTDRREFDDVDDRYHEEMHAILKHHKAVRVFTYGSELSIQSAHPLTTAQRATIRHAALNKGYNGISHQHGHDYEYAQHLKKPSNATQMNLGRTLRLGQD